MPIDAIDHRPSPLLLSAYRSLSTSMLITQAAHTAMLAIQDPPRLLVHFLLPYSPRSTGIDVALGGGRRRWERKRGAQR
jgi:hypothetical protein